MNNLYGTGYLEQQRSSGYKSTIYAMAEILDNSVDAGAKKVDIVFKESTHMQGQRATNHMSEIIFIDDGKGMNEVELNGCLRFADGSGRSDGRIGAFGVGLPNASISVGRRVEVYTKFSDGHWHSVYLDLDEQGTMEEPGYHFAAKRDPKIPGFIDIGTAKTIVRWAKLDRLDAAKARTYMERAKKLFGRIYRYKLQDELRITYSSILNGNNDYSEKPQDVIPYDPLFLMEKKNFITEHIWRWSEEEDPRGRNNSIPNNQEFTSKYHYKKFVQGCERNKTNRSLFQKFDDFWAVEKEFKVGSKCYKWKIKASFACSSISNPGIRNGGNTNLGQVFGEKMSGSRDFKSSNIFFVRADREIDFGSYGLYTVTDVKNRFWTIEIHFDSDLDELMGLSNTKQSVAFQSITQAPDNENLHNFEDAPIGLQRDTLWYDISSTIATCIKEMRKHLKSYARSFAIREEAVIRENQKDPKGPLPQPEGAVIKVFPKGKDRWTEAQKEDVITFLKEKYMEIPLESIVNQVNIFADGLTKTLVLYAKNSTNNLFELTEKRGIHITLINTEHIYYGNIIEPLKSNPNLKIFAISIEMLISACALEMDRLIIDNSDKYESPLETYLLQISSKLNEFIKDSGITIDSEEYDVQLVDDFED